ncbi:metalloregulator ArsR/SmtB family transcription factor [Erwiniaceae bacterium BAC15a-03b]|uniref:Metalloregulator ArsR/SmtB family transcription factor n=1 Tax=Winslowiella arboricola TaxID=2978220 RepID=A0A9J6PN71_9GAMM|nr:metalloregulator ArsR/SmtB family transcription factor [Winslowiella arboricola]MCU5772445.1 metalloregulator ArsR/SmtB family transcription factor [Winslowiella arboricola]MCU5779761.1 metalloregulator ArsR/SmtB family transcription factor [Winslowiella arboricola]
MIEDMAALLRLLGHPIRLNVALILFQQPQTVSELEEKLQIKQPNLSQHLAVLREAGLVWSNREAKSVTYAISKGMPQQLVMALSGLLRGDHAAANAPAASYTEEKIERPGQGDELVFATVTFPAEKH